LSNKSIIYFPGTVPKEQAPEPQPPKPKELSYLEIKELFDKQGIYVEWLMIRALYALGAYDLEKIAALSARELAKHQGVGPKKMAKLRECLQSKGLDLKE
jgi:hypothetical protein